MKKGFKTAFRWISEKLSLLASFAVLVSVLLLWGGWIEAPKVEETLWSLVAFSILGMLYSQLTQLDSFEKSLNSALDTFAGKLRSLDECQKELAARLRETRSSKPVELRFLGIDMASSWSSLNRLLEEFSDRRDISLKILMIDPKLEEASWSESSSVEVWAAKAAASLKEMEINVASPGSFHQRLKMEVRGYRDFPYVHGFYLGNGEAEVRYFAFCRWVSAERIDWGKDQYRVVEGKPSIPALADLAAIFDGAFDRYWNSSDSRRLLVKGDGS